MASRQGDHNWNRMSENLQDVIRIDGPLTLEAVAAAYQRGTGTTFCLGGLKLRYCIDTGLLQNIKIKGSLLTLEKETGLKGICDVQPPAPMSGSHVIPPSKGAKKLQMSPSLDGSLPTVAKVTGLKGTCAVQPPEAKSGSHVIPSGKGAKKTKMSPSLSPFNGSLPTFEKITGPMGTLPAAAKPRPVQPPAPKSRGHIIPRSKGAKKHHKSPSSSCNGSLPAVEKVTGSKETYAVQPPEAKSGSHVMPPGKGTKNHQKSPSSSCNGSLPSLEKVTGPIGNLPAATNPRDVQPPEAKSGSHVMPPGKGTKKHEISPASSTLNGSLRTSEKITGPLGTLPAIVKPRDVQPPEANSGSHVMPPSRGAKEPQIWPASPSWNESLPSLEKRTGPLETLSTAAKPRDVQPPAPKSGSHVMPHGKGTKKHEISPASSTLNGSLRTSEKITGPLGTLPAIVKPRDVQPPEANSGSHVMPPSRGAKEPQISPSSPSASTVVYLIRDKASWIKTSRFISKAETKATATTLSGLSAISTGKEVALRVEGTALGTDAGVISLIEVAADWPTFNGAIVFDVVNLEGTESGRHLLRQQLCPLLGDTRTIKVVHNFTNQAIALKLHFGKDLQIRQTLDAQIAFETVHGKIFGDMVSITNAFMMVGSNGPTSLSGRETPIDISSISKHIRSDKLMNAARATISLLKVVDGMMKTLVERGEWDIVIKASSLRTEFAMDQMLHDTRRMTFRNKARPTEGEGRLLVSYELLKAKQEEITVIAKQESMAKQESFTVKDTTASSSSTASFQDVLKSAIPLSMIQRLTNRITQPVAIEDPNSPKELLELMPQAFLLEHLSDRHKINLPDLCEVVLDEGTRPYAQFRGRGRVFLVTDESVVVTRKDIDKVVGKIERDGQFGGDNRAGFPGKLHRISVMRDKEGAIYGVTLRVGRFFKGSAGMVDDFTFYVPNSPNSPECSPSILILGEAGSGKTTVIRDICRKISAFETLVIVDTSNEIAGANRSPHTEAIGLSRRIMVADKSNQHRVMIEALQNHTPRTIVVDEISNNLEARACQDIKARGVRLVASAHGDLESLMKNPSLNTLVGGTTSVTLGDSMAKENNGGNKVQTQRAGIPVFDTIIQLERAEVNTWSVVRNVAPAVDALLSGGMYEMERRTRIVDDKQQDPGSDDVAFLLQHRTQANKRQQFY